MKTITKFKRLALFALALGAIVTSCKDDDEEYVPTWVMTTDVSSILLDMNDESMLTETITATTTKDGEAFDETYTFVSSDPLVATVSDAGVVTAVAGGSSTVTVTGETSGETVTVSVEVTGADPAPTFTKIAEIDGSVKYTWEADRMTVTNVVVYNEAGDTELVAGSADDEDKTAFDYVFESDYANGSFSLVPTGRSDNFKAGLTVLVKITVEDAEDPVWKNPTIHDQLSYTATISSLTFEWDTATVNSGIVPTGVNVYLRNDPVNDGDPYTKGDAVSYAEVGSVVGDTAITVSALISNVSYWFEVVDNEGAVLIEANTTIPSPITQVKAANTESVWYGDASSAGNKYAECRRIADRISIGQGLTYDQIAKVEIKDASGAVLSEVGEWTQEIAVYEYSYINTDAPNVIADFDAAVALKAAYIHDKIDPDDNANGEFKYISFYDIPYSESEYTVVITTKDGEEYSKNYQTKKKYSVRNRAQVRANDHIYADAADINAASLIVMYYSNVPGDAITYSFSDDAVAAVSTGGEIMFKANGIAVLTVTGEGGTFSAEVAAAPTYCNNYSKFQDMVVGTATEMTFWSPVGNSFASATSSDESVATVSGNIITAVAAGSAVITIVDNLGNVALMTVTVAAGE